MSAQASNPQHDSATKAETLRGGVTLTVTFIDGEPETVLVRQLPVRDFDRWLAVLDDEPRAVELFTDRPKGWADRLDLESVERVIAEGERVNRDFFERWLHRRTQRKEWLAPILLRNAAAGGVSSPTGSPSLP